MSGKEPQWHRRLRTKRRIVRALLAVAGARQLLSQHHGGGGNNSGMSPWVCGSCATKNWDGTTKCRNCDIRKDNKWHRRARKRSKSAVRPENSAARASSKSKGHSKGKSDGKTGGAASASNPKGNAPSASSPPALTADIALLAMSMPQEDATRPTIVQHLEAKLRQIEFWKTATGTSAAQYVSNLEGETALLKERLASLKAPAQQAKDLRAAMKRRQGKISQIEQTISTATADL